MDAVTKVELAALPLFRRGKVRDTFDLGDRLLIVATDRISAFDVVLPTPLPGKGMILTSIARRWLQWSRALVPNHLLDNDVGLSSLPLTDSECAVLAGRSMLVRKAQRIDIECVVRGFVMGSAWTEYLRAGTIGGESAPSNLEKGSELPEPRFTPAIKNDDGHDENISRALLRDRIGTTLAVTLESSSHLLFAAAAQAAKRSGLILVDTKFEFGFVGDELVVIDELLTPDSSRFWDAAQLERGGEPASFDKQIVRDWLEASGWTKRPPGPLLPRSVVDETLARYREVEARILAGTTGDVFDGPA